MIPKLNQPAYAHTFTGDESASFLSVIRILQAENNLVQTNLASNPTLAQEHAKAVIGVVNGNHTFGILPDEVSENNKRVASDVIRGANALQTTVSSKPAPTPADVGAKINYLNGILQEAVTVRVPKSHTINSTIIAQATKNLVNETLRQYGYAFGISKGNTARIQFDIKYVCFSECTGIVFTIRVNAESSKITCPKKSNIHRNINIQSCH